MRAFSTHTAYEYSASISKLTSHSIPMNKVPLFSLFFSFDQNYWYKINKYHKKVCFETNPTILNIQYNQILLHNFGIKVRLFIRVFYSWKRSPRSSLNPWPNDVWQLNAEHPKESTCRSY
jgi:hypothetical protein